LPWINVWGVQTKTGTRKAGQLVARWWPPHRRRNAAQAAYKTVPASSPYSPPGTHTNRSGLVPVSISILRGSLARSPPLSRPSLYIIMFFTWLPQSTLLWMLNRTFHKLMNTSGENLNLLWNVLLLRTRREGGSCWIKNAQDIAGGSVTKPDTVSCKKVPPTGPPPPPKFTIKATVPGDLITDLQNAGLVGDPLCVLVSVWFG
jgi:hypothetical protein